VVKVAIMSQIRVADAAVKRAVKIRYSMISFMAYQS
jgi:hypothetical protein